MENTEEREYQNMQETLLQEVSSAFPAATTVNPPVAMPSSMEIPATTMLEMNEASSSSLPTNATKEMQEKLDRLRMPAVIEAPEKEKEQKEETPFYFNIPATNVSTYPGLDGHPRRITPIPVSTAVSDQMVKSPEQIARESSDLIQRLKQERQE